MNRKPVVGIVGGGMVGGALAALLAQERSAFERVVLVEAGQPPTVGDEVDLRVVALSAASQTILDHVGAWDAIASTRISPYREMVVWDAASSPGKPGSVHFSAAEMAAPTLGHIVENNLIRHALWQQLASLNNVEILAETRVTNMVADEDGVALTLDNGRSLDLDLVVAADGARSPLRKMLGIETRQRSYHQKALVTHLRCERDHKETAWQRFLPGGPLAFLPLADGRCSIVWSCEEAEAERLLELDDAAFLRGVEAASDHVLGSIIECGQRVSFPLHLLHAQEYCRQRVVLVGDAAHSIHPLAGQGVNLGLLDAAALSETLTDAAAEGLDIGDRAVLRRYERWRKGDNLAMLWALDGINRLFVETHPAASVVRGLGLTVVNALPPARKMFMRRAMGLGGDMPRIASMVYRRSRMA